MQTPMYDPFLHLLMALFSLHHSSIGKTTHKTGTAAAHVRYITRPDACADLLANRMPGYSHAAQYWISQKETRLRKNGRILDKIMSALPRELRPLQRRKLIRDFCEQVTKNRASYFAALHQVSGNDRNNPHAHILIHDRDPETGKTVVQLSNKNSTSFLRQLWAKRVNHARERAGQTARVDHRSYQERGIQKHPTRHQYVAMPDIVTALHALGDRTGGCAPLRKIVFAP